MKRSTVLFLIISLIFAAGCARLGFWQLARRTQRLAMNARIEGRIVAPPIPVATASGDTTRIRFSRVTVGGNVDYEHEILLTYKGHDGSPGVDVLTPVHVPGLDSAVLVNRGWVYSPDGSTIELRRWRDTTATFTGYIDSFESDPLDTVREGRIRRMSYEAIARAMPFPIRRFYVVALGDSASVVGTAKNPAIIRLGAPKLDEGPHLSYAFQWFGFATIALVGGGTVAARSMQKVSS